MHPFDTKDIALLKDKYVLIKESSMSKAKPELFLRQLTGERSITGEALTVVPHMENGRLGRWTLSSFEGWVSVEDAEKIIMWENLGTKDDDN